MNAAMEEDCSLKATFASERELVDDVVLVRELIVDTHIGAYECERAGIQSLSFDVDIGADRIAACVTDRLTDTIDYAKVAETIREVCAFRRPHLLEALAENVSTEILRRFPAKWVRITVAKRGILARTRCVGVSITRSRRAKPKARAGPA